MPSRANKHVLICPLNWGLGHATRCVPVIRALLKEGFLVSIAAEGRPLDFLKEEFPQLNHFVLPGFTPIYPEGGNMVLKMARSIPKFLRGIKTERNELQKLVDEHFFDIIISDNRYGLFNQGCYNILIIHQLMIKTPLLLKWAEPLLWLVNRWVMRPFQQVWIPDLPGNLNLSGDLSHAYPLPKKAKFIGALSRFKNKDGKLSDNKANEIIAIVSGPEPQRSIFTNLLINQLPHTGENAALVCGNPASGQEPYQIGNLTVYQHLASDILFEKIKNAKLIITRPGYSTLMDLSVCGGKALFVPTPGQTEQEYLGRKLMKEGRAYLVNQYSLNLKEDIPRALKFKGISAIESTRLLAESIKKLKVR